MGLIAKLSPSLPFVDHLLYTVPPSKKAFFTINIANRNAAMASAALAIVDSADVSIGVASVLTKGQGFTSIPTITVEGECTAPATVGVDTMALASAVISKAGEGYAVDDILTLGVVGATALTIAKLKVLAVSATGGITSVAIDTDGVYTAIGLSATVTGGTGAGATFESLTWGINTVSMKTPGNGYKTNPTLSAAGGVGAAFSTQMIRIVEPEDFFEPEIPLARTQPFERTGMVLSAGQSIYIRPSVGGMLNAHIWGYEELA